MTHVTGVRHDRLVVGTYETLSGSGVGSLEADPRMEIPVQVIDLRAVPKRRG